MFIPLNVYPQLTVVNPGLEGTAGECFVTPTPWTNCMPYTNFITGIVDFTTPDTQPGCYNIFLAPSEGNSYIGFGHIPDYDLLNPGVGATEWQEGFSQELSSPMIANGCPYIFTIDLANGLTADPWNGTDIATTIGEVRVFGGFDFCSEEELLWTSGPVTNENWDTFTVEFTPNDDYSHILFQCVKTEEDALCAYVLADNITPIVNTPPIINAGENQELCQDFTNLEASQLEEGENGNWTIISGNGDFIDNNSPNTIVNNLNIGENIFEWSVTTDCSDVTSTDQVIVIVVEEPIFDIGLNQELCENFTYLEASQPGFDETGSWSIISGAGSFENINDPNSLITNLGEGENILQWTLSSIICGDFTDQISINYQTVNTIISDVSNYNEFNISCNGFNDGYIELTTTGGYPPYSYSWIGDNNFTNDNQNIYNLNSGLYECTILDSLNCEMTISVLLNEPDPIEIELIGVEDMDCFNSPYIDFNIFGGNGTLEGILNTSWGETTTFIYEQENQWYFEYENFDQWDGEINLSITDINGCNESINNIAVQTWDNPIANFNTSTDNTIVSDLITLTDLSSSEVPIISWEWDFGDGNISNNQNPMHFYENEGQYLICLKIQDENDCEDVKCHIINIYSNSYIYIPNIFTINEDNLNEKFLPIITGLNENSYKMFIYDRWGKLLFKTDDYKEGWNGKYKGEQVTQDVYSYKISYKTISGGDKLYIGKVTLVK